MTAYDATRFDPPAPLAYVTLRKRNTGATWIDVPIGYKVRIGLRQEKNNDSR